MSASVYQSVPATGEAPDPGTSAAVRWAGRVATAIVVLFAAFDAVAKLAAAKLAVDATVQLGYQPHHVRLIGLFALVFFVLYLVPRTAPLGAILWTGYLGGAVASNVRLDAPVFTHTLFPVYFAAVLWFGVYARDPRVRALVRPIARPRLADAP